MEPEPVVNFSLLASALEKYRGERELTLRSAAAESGVSASTLSRIERKEARPDLDTVRLIADWIGLPLDKVLQKPRARSRRRKPAAKAAEIMARFEAHLRAEPDLDPETADALAGILKHAYRQMVRER